MFSLELSLMLVFLITLICLLNQYTAQYTEICELPWENGTCVPVERCTFGITKNQGTKNVQEYIEEQRKQCTTKGTACCSARHLLAAPSNSGLCSHKNLGLLGPKCYASTSNKVAAGLKTDLHEFPFMALLGYYDRRPDTIEFRCAGTLISKRYVLTAAHCNNIRSLKIVRLGEHNLSSPEEEVQDIEIQEIIVHPNYDKSRNGLYDISLLRLKQEAILVANKIATICLPVTNSLQNIEISKGIINGWGRIENTVSYSDIPYKALIDLFPIDKCEMVFRTNLSLSPNLCGGGKHKMASCTGDSGGPLLSEPDADKCNDASIALPKVVQFGIISAGYKSCGETNALSIFTKVADYMNWILDNLEP